MTDRILTEIARERADFIAQFERVPAAHRDTPPADGGWSAAQVVEHVARLDRSVCRLVAHFATKPRTATPEELAQARLSPTVIAAARDRGRKVEAPEPVRPPGAFAAADVLAELARAREALIACYHGADAELLDGAIYPHPYFGPLTLRAWFELTGHHDARHAQQLAEIAARFGAA